MDRTMMHFQTRGNDECNLTGKACWWRTSCNRDGVATDEIIKEIISHFKDYPSIKIIKSHISQDDQKISLKLATGNSIKKIIDKLDTKIWISFDSIPLGWSNLHKNYIWASITTSKWDYCEWKIFPSCRENSMYHSSFQERRQTRLYKL